MEETQIAESSQEQPQEELSVEERFANAMGLEEDPQEQAQEEPAETEEVEAEQEEQPEESDTVELEINGEVYEVPKELKDGYLRQQDYTRKTQEVAAERQAIQEQRQAIEAERQAFQNQVMAQQQNFELHAQVAALDQQISAYQNIDWKQLMDSDPVEAMKLDHSLRELRESRNHLVQQAVSLQQQMDYQRQVQYAQMIEQGKKQIAERIPDWSADKAKALRDYGVNFGFTAEEMAQVIDPRHVEVLHKAYLYDQLQQARPEAVKKVAASPKTLTKNAPKQPQSKQEILKKIVKTSKDKYAKHDAIQKLIASRI